MSNKEIINKLKLTVSLLELLRADSFKIRSYSGTIFTLEKMDKQIEQLINSEIIEAGISKRMVDKIVAINTSGSFKDLDDLLNEVPSGVMDMLNINGIGAKKIRTIWQELRIESLDGLLIACRENRLQQLKGFTKKTEQAIIDQILFIKQNIRKLRYADAEAIVEELIKNIKTNNKEIVISTAGQLRRYLEVVDIIQLVIATDDRQNILNQLNENSNIKYNEVISNPFIWRGNFSKKDLPPIEIFFTAKLHFESTLFLNSASENHLSYIGANEQSLQKTATLSPELSEKAIYKVAGLEYILPEMREGNFEIDLAKEGKLPQLVEEKDLKGILHNHSTYSDGKHTLEEMATYCKELGYQYLGISDHSKTAFYANGLEEERIVIQHKEIDDLNKKLTPFKIFKGIESDILSDGNLDYTDDILAGFDFIIASIHSNLNMGKEKATQRLIKAIENPYTTILGHPTGRILLKREGYPIDHKAVIDACAKHGVIIEINANPRRLDLDWRYVRYALNQNVIISINPDAHEKAGYAYIKYGLLVGRKAGLTKEMTFNTLTAEKVDAHFKSRKTKM